ncbi:MAG: hypothetical protein WCT77_09090 [Bacteroidota bacterium]|jgi:hypothetical protein
MKLFKIIVLIFVCFLPTLNAKSQPDCEIYNVLYNHILLNWENKKYLIREFTTDSVSSDLKIELTWIKKYFPKNLTDNYTRINIYSKNIKNCFDTIQIKFFTYQKEKEIFNEAHALTAWNFFYKEYPEYIGVIWFSNIAYNKKRTKALVSYSVMSKGQGIGFLVELHKKVKKFKIFKRKKQWASS